MSDADNMKPIIILAPGVMSDTDKQMLRDNGLCVVEAADPSKVKFVDPIPSAVQRTKIETAAIQLSRILLTSDNGYRASREDVCKIYVEALIKGTPLQSGPTQEERERDYFNNEKRLELQRLAREEAKEERAAAKAAKKSGTKQS